MPSRTFTGARFGRRLLLGTAACLAASLGEASAQGAGRCPDGLNCNASGADVAQLKPIVDGAVGRALADLRPVPDPRQPDRRSEPTAGAIVGVSWKGQRSYFGYGRNTGAFDAGTIVEMGSITKVYTTALLAEAVLERNASLDETLWTYRSAVGLPDLTPCGGRATLRELADFSSGMPRQPDDLPSRNAVDNGIRNYTEGDYKKWISRWVPMRASPGQCPTPEPYAYSNASVGLLGYIVAHQFGKPWATLIADNIAGPLGMTSTFVPGTDGSVPPELAPRIAVGRGRDYRPVAPWPYFAWYAAGVLRSDASDALSFGEAGLGNGRIDGALPRVQRAVDLLNAAITMGRTTTYPVYGPDGGLKFRQGLAWVQVPAQPRRGYVPLWFKNGGTDGFRTVLVLNPAKDLAIFVAADQVDVDATRIGIALARAID